MPCKYFGANAAWLRLAVISHKNTATLVLVCSAKPGKPEDSESPDPDATDNTRSLHDWSAEVCAKGDKCKAQVLGERQPVTAPGTDLDRGHAAGGGGQRNASAARSRARHAHAARRA